MYLTLLDGATAEAAGDGAHVLTAQARAVDPVSGSDTSKQLVQVDITGAPSAVTVRINVSVKDDNYGVLATHIFSPSELTAGFAVFAIDAGVVSEWFQGEVETLTGGTSPTVTMSLFWGLI